MWNKWIDSTWSAVMTSQTGTQLQVAKFDVEIPVSAVNNADFLRYKQLESSYHSVNTYALTSSASSSSCYSQDS